MPIKVVKEGESEKEVVVFSYSSYSVYKQCPKKYYLRKCLKVPVVEDETFTIPGRIVHNAAGHYYDTGSFERFDPEFLRAELEKNSHIPTVNLEKGYGSFDKAYDLLKKSADNLKMFILTREQGKQFMSEKWFGVWNAPLYLSNNLAIQGAADLIELNPNGTALLYDFKTSWNMKSVSRDQLILYAIAAKLKWDVNVTMASFFLLPANKQNFFTFTDFDKQQLLNSMQQAANDILAQKENLPAIKNDKCKFCPYYAQCEANQVEHQVESLNEGTVSFGSFGNFGADL